MSRVLPRGAIMSPLGSFEIPNCPECDSPGVRWRGAWVCKFCFEFADGKTPILGTPERIPLASVLPNRAARRRR